MIIDIAEQIRAISREVTQRQTESGETVAVTLQRRYPADQADVWEAITDPERYAAGFCRSPVISAKAGVSSSKEMPTATSLRARRRAIWW
jgi:hypothetical protein